MRGISFPAIIKLQNLLRTLLPIFSRLFFNRSTLQSYGVQRSLCYPSTGFLWWGDDPFNPNDELQKLLSNKKVFYIAGFLNLPRRFSSDFFRKFAIDFFTLGEIW